MSVLKKYLDFIAKKSLEKKNDSQLLSPLKKICTVQSSVVSGTKEISYICMDIRVCSWEIFFSFCLILTDRIPWPTLVVLTKNSNRFLRRILARTYRTCQLVGSMCNSQWKITDANFTDIIHLTNEFAEKNSFVFDMIESNFMRTDFIGNEIYRSIQWHFPEDFLS